MMRSSRKSDDLQSFKVFKVFRYLTIFSQIFYKKAVLKYFTKFTEKHLCMKHAKHTILWGMPSTLFYESLNACYFMKHAKHCILWSTSSPQFCDSHHAHQFFDARKARHFMKHAKHVSTPKTRARQSREHTKHVKHAKHATMQARYLGNSIFANVIFAYFCLVETHF